MHQLDAAARLAYTTPRAVFFAYLIPPYRARSIGVVALACGEKHTAVLLSTGNAFTWGWNDHGQLGSGSGQGTHTPMLVKSPPDLRFTILRGLACGPNSTAVWS